DPGQHGGPENAVRAQPVHGVEDVGQGHHGGAHDVSTYRRRVTSADKNGPRTSRRLAARPDLGVAILGRPCRQEEGSCPSQRPRSTPRCWDAPRRTPTLFRPSTAPPRRPSTPPSKASPTPAVTASSSSRPAARSLPPASGSRTWSPERWRWPSSLAPLR